MKMMRFIIVLFRLSLFNWVNRKQCCEHSRFDRIRRRARRAFHTIPDQINWTQLNYKWHSFRPNVAIDFDVRGRLCSSFNAHLMTESSRRLGVMALAISRTSIQKSRTEAAIDLHPEAFLCIHTQKRSYADAAPFNYTESGKCSGMEETQITVRENNGAVSVENGETVGQL